MSSERVRVAFGKWGGGAHWELDGVRLGQDEHGAWLGAPAGTHVCRPGAAFDAPLGFVMLLPSDRPFVASFYDRGDGGPLPRMWVEVYVDVTTVPRWDPTGSRVTMVDLDLDVVRGRTGRVWVDDEDDFARHRRTLGYPDEVVALAERSCARVLDEVTTCAAPYDGSAEVWLSRMLALGDGAATAR